MPRRKKKPSDASKNRKLDEFLKALKIKDEKRDKIVAFVEELTWKQMRGLSIGVKGDEEEKNTKLRLRMPWNK